MKIGQVHDGSGVFEMGGGVVGVYWVELVGGKYIERVVTKKGTTFPFDNEVKVSKPVAPPFSPVKPSAFLAYAAGVLGVLPKDCDRWEGTGWLGPNAF